jgi:hypothetical protein
MSHTVYGTICCAINHTCVQQPFSEERLDAHFLKEKDGAVHKKLSTTGMVVQMDGENQLEEYLKSRRFERVFTFTRRYCYNTDRLLHLWMINYRDFLPPAKPMSELEAAAAANRAFIAAPGRQP